MSKFTAKKKVNNANIKVELKEKNMKENRIIFVKKCKFTRNVMGHKLMCPVTCHNEYHLEV